ncbi:HlyD family efflux transporter periplasmic adaptor subunit [Phormidium tenue FACHB-886]|nr:HlyD family efflux transporter periplasmic adaptor subunit [Phormidium tenue FACHB-886]
MSNPSNLQEKLARNGHYPSENSSNASAALESSNSIFQEEATLNSVAQTDLPQEAQPQEAQDDWSSVTQDMADALPRPWTRGLLHVLLGFMMIGLPWAMSAKVDETGSARGRLEPQGRSMRLDAPVNGSVIDVNVKQGQAVQSGQVLVELDSELARTELQRTQEELQGHQDRLTQLELMENQLGIAVREQQFQIQAQRSAQLAQLDQTQEQLSAAHTESELAAANLEREQTEVKRYESLKREGALPEVKVVEAERLRDESRQQHNQAQAQIQQSQTELKKQQSNYEEITQSGEVAILQTKQQAEELEASILETRAQIAQARKQIQSLQVQLKQHSLRAPTDGTVFQLAVQQPGSVVQLGQEIVQIAPKDAPLVFRAQMPSQETGFLKLNAPVKLKFDAYPFQDYGVVPGRLRWIAPDSKIVETAQGNVEVFEVEVVLDQNYIQNQGRPVRLTAGQTANAEVVVRQRRVIDFILDPFKKLQKGGLEM